MFAYAFATLDHLSNFVVALLFPIGVRLIEGVPLTPGEYVAAYAVGTIITYMIDLRLKIFDWARTQVDRLRQ